jgi:tetratricopeptide (TPR) repeat protein
LAIRHGSLGNYDKAIELSIRALELTPDDFMAHDYLGGIYQAAGRHAEAEASFRRAVELKPDVSLYRFNLGVSILNQSRREEALEEFNRAIEVSPDGAIGAYNARAFLLRRNGDLVSSAASFRKVYEIEPDTARGLRNLAQAQLDEADYEGAAESLTKATETEPEDMETRRFLANVFQQLGRFAEARPHFEKVIEAAPRLPGPYIAIARNNPMTEEDRPFINKMIRLAQSNTLNIADRGSVQFALGKVFEDLGDYKEAMMHYDEANGITQHARGEVKKASDEFREANAGRIIRAFTKETFEENASIGSENDVPLILVGMYRSGLTLLDRILSSHPEVGSAGNLGFWTDPSRDVFIGPKRSVAPGRAASLGREYERILQETAPGKRYVVDRTANGYLALGQMHMAMPKARIIHIRRNALDTCLSIYVTQNDLLEFAGDRRRILNAYEEYSNLMDHWKTVIPSDRFLEIDYEQLVQEPETSIRAILPFLGIEWSEACLHPEQQKLLTRVPGFWQLHQQIFTESVERWKRFEPWLGELAALNEAD